ncbi:10281_t:CDS:2 [Acaulospora morrowiae]|uniref:10281_t:CDS:1 n=1 Tax=Acaulospora morrowiae TaxID=94023 RepID=A0A9N8W2X9_9GLOM|nr:10281_t:CDS:2 [Acaulospora morrowiae]
MYSYYAKNPKFQPPNAVVVNKRDIIDEHVLLRKIDGDEKCHMIANSLGGSGDCENCMSCSRKMNNDMRKMENFVKKNRDEGNHGRYLVYVDDKEYANAITQIFRPHNKKEHATTTVIYRKQHNEL